MSDTTILIFGFLCSMGYAYWNQVRYDAQVNLNDTLVGIIRKQTAQLEEYRDAYGK